MSERYLKDIASSLKDIKRELQKMNRSEEKKSGIGTFKGVTNIDDNRQSRD